LCTDLLPGFYVSTAVAGGVDVAGFIVACPVPSYAPACPGVLGLFTEKWDAASVTLISAGGDDMEVTVAMFSLEFPAPTSVATGGRPFCAPNVVNGVATDERADYVFSNDEGVTITGCVSPAPTAGAELARCASALVSAAAHVCVEAGRASSVAARPCALTPSCGRCNNTVSGNTLASGTYAVITGSNNVLEDNVQTNPGASQRNPGAASGPVACCGSVAAARVRQRTRTGGILGRAGACTALGVLGSLSVAGGCCARAALRGSLPKRRAQTTTACVAGVHTEGGLPHAQSAGGLWAGPHRHAFVCGVPATKLTHVYLPPVPARRKRHVHNRGRQHRHK
jgi:hypothetical protein